jgi:hypothetical protein
MMRAITVATAFCWLYVGHHGGRSMNPLSGAVEDDRGYVYIVDRANTGLHILQLAGEARKAANLP